MTTSPETGGLGAPPARGGESSDPGMELARFVDGLTFRLDPFQVEACEALERGHGVLVCAPTGAGKTVVGEFAVHLALAAGRKCFYTTPIKALSNQKHSDLVRRYGADRIGLLTGDQSINGDAPVVVMTTEVLRNMLYAGSNALQGLSHVVMDEVHFLADRMRGAVWEEVILHLSEDVRLVSLSASSVTLLCVLSSCSDSIFFCNVFTAVLVSAANLRRSVAFTCVWPLNRRK